MAKDAAEMTPRLHDDDDLLPRDNSGGIDFTPYTAVFGDGGRVTGPKTHLSVAGKGAGDNESRQSRVPDKD